MKTSVIRENYAHDFMKSFVGVCRIGVMTAALLGAAQAQGATPPATLADVQAAQSGLKTTLPDSKDIRGNAMRDAALSFGARSGLARRTWEIQESIKLAALKIDLIWNFRRLMLADNVVPAVLTEADGSYTQSRPDLLRIVDKNFKILAQPRFSSAVPNWREYLIRDFGVVETAPTPLLPRNDDERKNWSAWVAEGWAQGVSQADQISELDLNRLRRDFNGMVLYRQLVYQHMVSLPYIAKSNNGVTGDDQNLNINDITLQITAMPAFNRESADWKVIAQ